jgi:hypothetical protein
MLIANAAYAGEKGYEYTTFFGFTLNEVTLSDIQKKLGNSPMIETGDAGDYEACICYLLPSGYTIRFLSGELGGQSHELGGYSVQNKITEADEKCMHLYSSEAKRFKPEVGKLKIGMTKKEFIKNFGEKIKWTKDKATIFFESKRKMTKKEIEDMTRFSQGIIQEPYFDIGISLISTFKEGRMIKFTVWRGGTY